MKRLVLPEILDALPENHPDAAASRRDLRLINDVMGNPGWIVRELRSRLRRNDRILEIGAGTGDLGFALRAGNPQIPERYCGLDLWSRPRNWPAKWSWVQEDLLEFDGYGQFDVLVANLILHQFDDVLLEKLGEKLRASKIRLIVASEPARHRLHQWQLRLLHPLKLNYVSRHDGHVSIRGGFRGTELPELLGLAPEQWQTETARTFRGAYRMIAARAEGGTA